MHWDVTIIFFQSSRPKTLLPLHQGSLSLYTARWWARTHLTTLVLLSWARFDRSFSGCIQGRSPSTQPCIILYCWNFPRGQNSDWFGWSPVVIQPYISSIEGLPGILPWRIQFHLAQCVHSLNGSVPPERLKNGWLRSRSKELLQSSCTVKLILIKIDYSIWDTWVINF